MNDSSYVVVRFPHNNYVALRLDFNLIVPNTTNADIKWLTTLDICINIENTKTWNSWRKKKKFTIKRWTLSRYVFVVNRETNDRPAIRCVYEDNKT